MRPVVNPAAATIKQMSETTSKIKDSDIKLLLVAERATTSVREAFGGARQFFMPVCKLIDAFVIQIIRHSAPHFLDVLVQLKEFLFCFVQFGVRVIGLQRAFHTLHLQSEFLKIGL
jgi:hypothetical protein